MTYYCAACCMNWWPYQTSDGACPECGGGTRRTQEPGSLDADARYKAVSVARAAASGRDRAVAAFEAFYAARESRLNGLDTLPVAEPVRPVDRPAA